MNDCSFLTPEGVMAKTIARFFAFIALLLLACSPPPRFINTKHGPPMFVKIWVDPESKFPAHEALAGCNLWNEADIFCTLAETKEEGAISMYADGHFCGPDKDGKEVLATAYPKDKSIKFREDCFWAMGALRDKFDAKKFRLVTAHEVGHQFGIWKHVPKDCDDKVLKGSDGTPICGAAIMNPNYDSAVEHITPADAAALDRRSIHYTVLPQPRVNDASPKPPMPDPMH
jgi:hypothetical protein